LAHRLRGATEDELAKDADELLKLVKPQQQPTGTRPVADLRPGALPTSEQQNLDIDGWIRDKARRR